MFGPTVEIIIKKGGDVVIEGQGFSGPACEAATQALQEALGTTEEQELKQEYYEPEQLQQITEVRR